MHREAIEKSIVPELNVALVCADAARLEELAAGLRGLGLPLRMAAKVGGVHQAARVADEERPDVLLVEGVRHDEDELHALEPVTPKHPNMAVILLSSNHSPDFLRQGMRIGLREILPMPAARAALHDAIVRAHHRLALVSRKSPAGRVLSFAGCKGGCGVTFLATNLAYAIATQEQKKVAVIDMAVQHGDASLCLTDRTPVATLADVAREIDRLDHAFLSACMIQVEPNLALLAAPDAPEDLGMLRGEHIDALLWTAASAWDVVIVDLGTCLDERALRVIERSESLFLVMQLGLPYVRGAKRALQALTARGYARERTQLLVNRNVRGPIESGDVAQALRHEVARAIPSSYRTVADSINQGVPILKMAPRDPVAKALKDFAAALVQPKKSAGLLSGLLAR